MTPEAHTRKTRIDDQLRLAGWNLDDPSQVVEEYELDRAEPVAAPAFFAEAGRAYGKQFVDYVLLRSGRIVAVVEAKKASADAQRDQEQALQYAQNIQRAQQGPLPFVFYTNGHDIWMWESGVYPPTKVRGYPTPADMDWLIHRHLHRKPLSVELINKDIAGRAYQISAIRAVLEGVERRRRKFLLVMATGTGKTRTAMGLIDVLVRAQWARRVLFLVDRLALRDQALDDFHHHLPDSPSWPRADGHNLETAWDNSRRLYASTYPAMLRRIEEGNTPATYLSPHFFDLIIADESHRSIYNTYKNVLDWFGGLHLGLTATPTDHIGHDTFSLFDESTGHPTFAYSYQEAIEHQPPYLSRFEVLKIRSKFQFEGIRGGALPLPDQHALLAEGKDPAEIDFEGTELERKVTNADTNRLIIREFMEDSRKDPTGTLPGKSIFFAISKNHARRLAKLFDQLYPEHAGRLARVLVSEDSLVHGKGGLLDQFKNNDFPRVAISVDMLDTGVDIPEVVNLVFAKPVFSYTKFWQMIGRGTRIIDPARKKPWCPTKGKFLILDCWGSFEFFLMNPDGRAPDEELPQPVRLFRQRLDALEAALGTERNDVAELVIADLRADLATLPPHNAIVAEARATLAPLEDEAFWAHLSAAGLGLLCTTVAPLMRARPNVEAKGMRFEIEAVELLTAMVADDQPQVTALRDSLTAQVSELPLSVNTVAVELDCITAALDPAYWVAATPTDLQDLTRRLSPLMQFRRPPRAHIVELDLADQRVIKEIVPFGPEQEGRTTTPYRDRIEAEVRELVRSHPIMARVARGEAPDDAEMAALAQQLVSLDPALTEDGLAAVFDLRAERLLRLLRHVLGLERLPTWAESVTASFDRFVAQHNTLTELQLRFLRTLQSFVLQHRKAERTDLVSATFTQFHPDGIRGVFRGADLQAVVALAEGRVA
jgi:type I restriction enzyme R subunit